MRSKQSSESVIRLVARAASILLLQGAVLSAARAGAADVQVSESPPMAVPGDSSASATDVGAQEDQGLEQVVVTAQKRAQNLKDIPISITAVSADELARAQIVDYDDLSRAVPGMAFASGGSEGLDNIEIRGVSSTSGSATVGIYLDDVSMTVPNLYLDGATQPKLFDLERVEVLRGPQGTLYGASSMGGAVRFVTKQPDLNDFTSSFSSDVSNTDHASVNTSDNAAVNVPIIPGELGVRASIGYMYDSGYIDNYSLSGDLQRQGTNSEQALTAMVKATYMPAEGLTITPSLFYQRDHSGDSSVFFPAYGLYEQDKEVREPGEDVVTLPSLTIVKSFGFADLTSVTGYFDREYDRWQDGTYYNSDGFAMYYLDPIYPQYAAINASRIATLASPVHYVSGYHQPSEEIRLSSRPAAETGIPITWVTGLYYADQSATNDNFQTMPGINSLFKNIYGVSLEDSLVESTYGSPGFILFPNDVDYSESQRLDERQLAAFGQADIDIMSRLHATLGLRYLTARSAYYSSTYGFYGIGTTSPYENTAYFHGLTPKYGLSYDLTPDTNVYASASKGFRLGGSDEPIPFGPDSLCATDDAAIGLTSRPVTFKSDTLWSYELGSKSQLMDNKLSINAAGYYIDWSNIQQEIYLPICGYYFTSNVGNAESYGGELEVRYKPIEGLILGLSGSLDHTAITSTINAQTAAVGEHILNTPNGTVSASVMYQWPLGATAAVFVRTDYDYIGNSRGSYQPTNANFYNPAYAVANAMAGLDVRSWEFSIYGKNITNNHTIIQSPEINSVIEGYTVRPLTVGVTVKLRIH